MKKLIAICCLLFPLYAFAQQTFALYSVSGGEGEDNFTSYNIDAPIMKVWDFKSSVTVEFGSDKLPLKKDDSDGYVYSAKLCSNGECMNFLAYRSYNSQRIYLILIKYWLNGEELTITYKETL